MKTVTSFAHNNSSSSSNGVGGNREQQEAAGAAVANGGGPTQGNVKAKKTGSGEMIYAHVQYKQDKPSNQTKL